MTTDVGTAARREVTRRATVAARTHCQVGTLRQKTSQTTQRLPDVVCWRSSSKTAALGSENLVAARHIQQETTSNAEEAVKTVGQEGAPWRTSTTHRKHSSKSQPLDRCSNPIVARYEAATVSMKVTAHDLSSEADYSSLATTYMVRPGMLPVSVGRLCSKSTGESFADATDQQDTPCLLHKWVRNF